MKNSHLIILIIALLLFNICVESQSIIQPYKPKAIQLVPLKAHAFAAGEVKLLDGIFKESQDAEAKEILRLDIDRLLAPFLQESGLTPKAPQYQGWETRVLPGVALSFYLSGASRLYKSTGDQRFFDKINYALEELERCQKNSDGYLLGSKNGKKNFERAEKEGNYPGYGKWGNGEATPYYSVEKLMSGLRDVYRVCHIEKALQISIALGEYLSRHMSRIPDVELHKMMFTEYGGMNWVLADLYADTNDKKFLEMSKRWQDSITVVPMINGEDKLTNVHANMQFPKYEGLAARYPYSGNVEDFRGARNFWENVVYYRTYPTGGNSESEYFAPKNRLSKKLTPFTEENCNEYNMLRLTSLLNELEPKAEYADYIERTLFNHTLAAQNREDGRICYFLSLMPGTHKHYDNLEEFSCCVCSSLDHYTRHAEFVYYQSNDAIYINQFIASELNYSEKGIKIIQNTKFPESELSTIKIQCDKPILTPLKIRNPYWVDKAVELKLNNKKLKIKADNDGYFHISRVWNNNDIIEIKLPMGLRIERLADDKNMISFFYGPVLLCAELDAELANTILLNETAPTLIPSKLPVSKWLKHTNKPFTFETNVCPEGKIIVSPFYKKVNGENSIFWRIRTEQEQQEYNSKLIKNQKDAQFLDSITIDKVTVSDTLEERKHNMTGRTLRFTGNDSKILINTISRRTYWDAYGYDLKVDSHKNNILYCKYMGRSGYESWNCRITVDGTTIAYLKRAKDDSSPVITWEARYVIPLELTKNKKIVQIRFERIDNANPAMPRLTEMRILKE